MSTATSGGGGEGFPAETAVYQHRAILAWFPLQRERCPQEDVPVAKTGSSVDAPRAPPREAEGVLAEVSPIAHPRLECEMENLPQGLQFQ